MFGRPDTFWTIGNEAPEVSVQALLDVSDDTPGPTDDDPRVSLICKLVILDL